MFELESIDIDGLTKKFDTEVALDNVSFKIPIGTACLIAGPNGSGKTTLLNILIGLTRITAGSLTKPKGLSIGVSFQDPRIYENLTVYQNLKLFSGLKKVKDKLWADYLVDFFRLTQWKKFYASDLSTGNAKKLDICLSVLEKPDLLILDEPLSTLDMESRKSVLTLLKDLKQGGTTIIIASHHIDDFSSLIDNFVILSKGKIVFNNALPEIDNKKLVIELKYNNEALNQQITIEDKSFLLEELQKIDIEQCSEIVIKKYGYDQLYMNMFVQNKKI
jgi:ABC-2 type transport system ATP-binding protein